MILFSNHHIQRHFYAFAVGTVAGMTVGVVGWGGAQIIIPAMTLPMSVANLSQLSATGVSLTSLSLSTVSSGFKFWREDRVNLPLALTIGIPAVLSARVGTRIAQKLSGDALGLFFNGFSILLIPTHYWIQQRAKSRRKVNEEGGRNLKEDLTHINLDDSTKLLQHASFGLMSGVISALMGVGGLPLTMSYITEATNLPHHYVQGTAVCALAPSILMWATSRLNAIPLTVTGFVCLGAIVGGYAGADFAIYLNEEELRNLYMGSLVVFGGRSVYGAAHNMHRIIKARVG
jgi:uncharacterized membrane protein YfcA